MKFADAISRVVQLPGGRIHLVEQGAGPVVVLIHGFPESWYSWRHQLAALSAAGFRAVAIDVRGYGRSSKPAAIADYRMTQLVADNVQLLAALGVSEAVVVGHDWGSPIAANSALLRPDLFRAVGLLSVPYTPRSGPRPTEVFARMGDDRSEFYINYFQQPGRAESEIEADIGGWLRGIYAALSHDTLDPAVSPFFIPTGARMADRFPTTGRPQWLTEEDLAYYIEVFERTGFTGALNRYRNMDRDWEDLAAWTQQPIRQPSLFIAGRDDGPVQWSAAAIENYPTTLPGLRGSHLLDNTGHWVQQERPGEVNEILIDWLRSL